MGDIGSLKSLLNWNCFLLEKLERISFRGQEPESEVEVKRLERQSK